MQNPVKMVHDVSPTFSMDIAPKWPYFSGKTIFSKPQSVSKHLRRVQRSDKSLPQDQICPFLKENTSLSEPKANSEERRQRMNGFHLLSFLWVRLRLTQRCPVSVRPPPQKKRGQLISEWAEGELRGKIGNKFVRILALLSNVHYNLLNFEGGVKPITCHTILYIILGWNRWNVWFGIKEGSETPGCITYLISFSSEFTWVLLNRPNGHWVTPGQPSNTLFKSHNSQAQDFWTRRAMALIMYQRM